LGTDPIGEARSQARNMGDTTTPVTLIFDMQFPPVTASPNELWVH